MEVSKTITAPSLGNSVESVTVVVRPWFMLLGSWLLALSVAVVLVECLLVGHAPSRLVTQNQFAHQRGLSILPVAAQEVASAALGTDNSAYRMMESGSNYQATNPAQRLRTRFGGNGIHIYAGGLQLGLRLREVGYGASLRRVGDVRPKANANHVTFPGSELSQWYTNGPVGLEQGFTLSNELYRHPLGPLTLAMERSGDVTATISPDGQRLTFNGARGKTLQYGHLLATDAFGHRLHSWIELRRGRVLLRVDTHNARYPLRIDPLIQQGEKLTEKEEEIDGGDFGTSVALSSDGNTALIGASGDDYSLGAAWVLTRTGSTWAQQGPKLLPTGVENGSFPVRFGLSVALSSNGDIALIGSPGQEDELGAAWIFTRSDSRWTQGPELTGGIEESGPASFGLGVALSSDGDTALIGGYEDNKSVGAAWAFVRAGATWVQEGSKLTGSGTVEGSCFGGTLALSSDGNTALIGIYPGGYPGGAWVFTRSGSTWTQAELLEPGMGIPGVFGESVALSADGLTALIGDPDFPFSRLVGGAWVFTRTGSTWVPQGTELTSAESGETAFGFNVALSADGNSALIGSGQDSGGRGATWLFTRSGSTWTRQVPVLAGGEEENGLGMFGSSVALSSNATTALIGAPNDDEVLGAAGARGAIWMYVSAPPDATTRGVSNLGANRTTLNAEVDPRGLTSNAYFQYGTTAAYGQSTLAQSAGSEGTSPITVDVVGLSPATTYHFRVVAESLGGVAYGADQAFTTVSLIPEAAVTLAPVNTLLPAISGTPIRGQALSASQGSWTNDPASFGYQWQSCNAIGEDCANLSAATGATHILTQADVGHTLRVIVTGANTGGFDTATSTASQTVGSQVESAMTWNFGWSRRYTIVESLLVHEIPAGGIVEVTCHGKGCPFARDRTLPTVSRRGCRGQGCKAKHPNPSKTEVDLTHLFRHRHLGLGVQVAVYILRHDWVGKSYLFTMRANRTPHFQVTCVALGSSRSTHGC